MAMVEKAGVPEVYWLPGCTSCLRVKEFMERSGVAFDSVNLEAAPERGATLARLGAVVPAVVVGDRAVHGLDLAGVAALVGIDYEAPVILTPSELKSRYDTVAAALCTLIEAMPDGCLDEVPPDRDRTLRYLAAHAGTIMRKFLDAYDAESFDNAGKPPRELGESGTPTQLLAWATGTREAFDRWWDELGRHDALDRVLETSWGYRTLHEVLERAVWHTAQHTRQLEYFLRENLVVSQQPPLISATVLAGLPVPERIHV